MISVFLLPLCPYLLLYEDVENVFLVNASQPLLTRKNKGKNPSVLVLGIHVALLR